MEKHRLTLSSQRLEGQPMFRLLEKVNERIARGEDIIHFEIGDPDFETPQYIVKACLSSMLKGDTHYTNSSGDPAFKQAIVDYTEKDLGFTPDLNQIVVSPGSNCLIYCVIKCLVESDEEVIIPDPSFPSYYSVLNFLGITAVPVPLREINEFRMNPKDIRDRITKRTKLIILNSPQNPTGSVINKEEIQEIYDIAAANDIFILSDEIYRRMSYGEPVYSPCVYDHCKETTIMMTGFSKAFAMSGWRLGYMIGPEALCEKVSLLLQTTVSCTNSFIQKAGIAVLENHKHPDMDVIMTELWERKRIIVEGLNAIEGISCVDPKGAFYVFPNITGTGMDSQQFADFMLENGVALLPGTNFGKYCEGYVRLCYCTSIDNIREGLRRIKNALGTKMDVQSKK
jgi:aspartate/methionine/tyrosine aminotransferase